MEDETTGKKKLKNGKKKAEKCNKKDQEAL